MFDKMMICIFLICSSIMAYATESKPLLTDAEIKEYIITWHFNGESEQSTAFFNSINSNMGIILDAFLDIGADDNFVGGRMVLLHMVVRYCEEKNIVFNKNQLRKVLESLIDKHHDQVSYGTTMPILVIYGNTDSVDCILNVMNRDKDIIEKNCQAEIRQNPALKYADISLRHEGIFLTDTVEICLDTLKEIGGDNLPEKLRSIKERYEKEYGKDKVTGNKYYENKWNNTIAFLEMSKSKIPVGKTDVVNPNDTKLVTSDDTINSKYSYVYLYISAFLCVITLIAVKLLMQRQKRS